MTLYIWVVLALIILAGSYYDGIAQETPGLFSSNGQDSLNDVATGSRIIGIDDAALTSDTPLNTDIGIPAILNPNTWLSFLRAITADWSFLVGPAQFVTTVIRACVLGMLLFTAWDNRQTLLSAVRGAAGVLGGLSSALGLG